MEIVLGFHEVGRTDAGVVGGKGASLGELSRLAGVRVPDGFCVSTAAFQRVLGAASALGGLLDRLALLQVEDRAAIREAAAAIREVIEGTAIPEDVRAAISRFLARRGEHQAYAVRSSATAEDLPEASFAGQHDSSLNVVGQPAILQHVSRCWASLFTERAVTYRLRHGIDHRKVRMAVVVQEMLFPQAAGILFTADPVTANRKVSSIEAGCGLGEALVSGLVSADRYKVRDGEIIEKAERVLSDMADAEPGAEDILVTTFTDPSWTPLFVSIKGLVTEVGGLMTHGAVIAREYGLPAVVGVENATRLIKDGQRIRVHGTDGFVEVLA
jgi:rifampicin phosphotransferase